MLNDSKGTLARLGLLSAAVFATVAVIYPFLPIYLSLRGLTPSRIGIALAGVELAALAGAFVMPHLAELDGRFRTVMSVMAAMGAAGLAAMNFVKPFYAILAVSLFFGFFFKSFPPLADAYVSRILLNISRNYGIVRSGGTASFLLVSLALQISGILDGASPERFIAVFLVAIAFLAFVIVFIPPVKKQSKTSHVELRGFFKRFPPGFFMLLGLMFTGNIGLAVYNAFGSLFLSGLFSFSEVSGLMALAAVPEIPLMLFGGRMLKRFKHRKMLFIALTASILRLMTFVLLPYRWPVGISQLLNSVVFAMYLIASIDWINHMVPLEHRALGMSIFTSVTIGGSQLAGSFIGGMILEKLGFSALFGTASVFTLCALIWLVSDCRIGNTAVDKPDDYSVLTLS